MQVAYGITKRDFRARAVPLTLGLHEAHAFLLVAYYMQMDAEGEYPAVTKSQYGLYLDEDRTEMLVHWDYERNPNHPYPAAHVQVNGDAPHWHTLCHRARERLGRDCPERDLRDAHLPVGGRRFRPSLEDVIEFLVVEDLVEARPDWEAVLGAHRDIWEERQLRAAVRRHPADRDSAALFGRAYFSVIVAPPVEGHPISIPYPYRTANREGCRGPMESPVQYPYRYLGYPSDSAGDPLVMRRSGVRFSSQAPSSILSSTFGVRRGQPQECRPASVRRQPARGARWVGSGEAPPRQGGD